MTFFPLRNQYTLVDSDCFNNAFFSHTQNIQEKQFMLGTKNSLNLVPVQRHFWKFEQDAVKYFYQDIYFFNVFFLLFSYSQLKTWQFF